MKHSEKEEYLETLFHLKEKHRVDLASLKRHQQPVRMDILEEMALDSLVTLDGTEITFTQAGLAYAKKIVRRHRLAERLLVDVLHMGISEVEKSACVFEHMVADEITDAICTLLGHPAYCPHGSPIPKGDCCTSARQETASAVVSLAEAPLGDWFRIAYITSRSDERQQHLADLGVAPGNLVKVHQRSPSFILVLESTRIAMQASIAEEILVWKKEVSHHAMYAS